MEIGILLLAVLFIVIGVRGQAGNAATLLASEFTGANSFIPWFLAIMILGVIGYYRPVRPAADALLSLVILSIFISKGSGAHGFFAQLQNAFTTAQPSQSNANAAPSATSVNAVQSYINSQTGENLNAGTANAATGLQWIPANPFQLNP